MDNQLVPATEPIEAKLKRIAELKAELAKTDPLKKEMDELRVEVQYAMIAAKSKRTEPVAGIFAVREERKSLVIVDEQALEEFLNDPTNEIFDPQVYYKIDPVGIKQLQADRMRDYGEFLPGVEETVTETISIRSEKK